MSFSGGFRHFFGKASVFMCRGTLEKLNVAPEYVYECLCVAVSTRILGSCMCEHVRVYLCLYV